MSDIQAETDLFFVREEMLAAAPPPSSVVGPLAWARTRLASTPGDLVMTVLGVVFAAWAIWNIFQWAVVHATFDGADRTACIADTGACWAFVKAKFGQFVYGRYPLDERWRPTLVMLMLAGALVWMATPSLPAKRVGAIFALVVLPVLAFVLLLGGVFGLRFVETALWGGLLVTLVVSYVGIVASLPLGVLLALGRRSNMPAVRTFSIAFIELWRGVPLITVLFMASVMLPLFLPPGMNFDKLLRALIGVALFASAYMAEVVRGGLQAIPKGQYEAASAMGLGYWQSMRLIILPQALKLVIPGIVNTFIGLFKDTSLVIIIGLFDLLGVVRQNFADPNWTTPETPATGLVFAGFVFWAFCFAMSRYSQYVERRLHTGHRR